VDRDGDDLEQILLVLRPLPDELPWAVRLRHVLKRALRSWQLKCVEARLVGSGDLQPAPADAAEVVRLQALVETLTDRVEAQSELLSKRAEKTS
jgi:hypothetical protein